MNPQKNTHRRVSELEIKLKALPDAHENQTHLRDNGESGLTVDSKLSVDLDDLWRKWLLEF